MFYLFLSPNARLENVNLVLFALNSAGLRPKASFKMSGGMMFTDVDT